MASTTGARARRTISRLKLEHKRTDTAVSVPSHIGRKIVSALSNEKQHGTARQIKERIGEVVNLTGEVQDRSISAILIKKYRFASQPLSNLYSSLKKRELTKEECASVRRIVDGLTLEQKEFCASEWKRVSGTSEWREWKGPAGSSDSGSEENNEQERGE